MEVWIADFIAKGGTSEVCNCYPLRGRRARRQEDQTLQLRYRRSSILCLRRRLIRLPTCRREAIIKSRLRAIRI